MKLFVASRPTIRARSTKKPATPGPGSEHCAILQSTTDALKNTHTHPLPTYTMVAYEAVLPGAPALDAPKDEWLEYLREAHGDIEDAKATAIFIFDERDEELEAADIETVTDEPPTSTFT